MEKIIELTDLEKINKNFNVLVWTNLGAMASGSITPEEVGSDLIRFVVDCILVAGESKGIAENFANL